MTRFLDGLAWIGRYGTQGFSLSIFVGLALPWLAAAARPLLPVCIFVFTVFVFARADLPRLREAFRRPGRLALVVAWLVVVPAVLCLGIVAVFGRGAVGPDMALGLAIIGAAPPILSAPAIAAMLGLEPSLLLGATVINTLAAPLISPPIAEAIAGGAVPLDRTVLALRLALLIGGAIAAAAVWRRIVGFSRIAARGRSFDGAGVLVYGLFAVATMDGVGGAILSRPGLAAAYLAGSFGVSTLAMAASLVALRFLGPSDRLIFGYAAGQRNMGVLVAALGTAMPPDAFLFFCLAQFPIYLMPQLLRWCAPYVIGRDAPIATAPGA